MQASAHKNVNDRQKLNKSEIIQTAKIKSKKHNQVKENVEDKKNAKRKSRRQRNKRSSYGACTQIILM